MLARRSWRSATSAGVRATNVDVVIARQRLAHYEVENPRQVGRRFTVAY
jgi:hypothetical protein